MFQMDEILTIEVSNLQCGKFQIVIYSINKSYVVHGIDIIKIKRKLLCSKVKDLQRIMQ